MSSITNGANTAPAQNTAASDDQYAAMLAALAALTAALTILVAQISGALGGDNEGTNKSNTNDIAPIAPPSGSGHPSETKGKQAQAIDLARIQALMTLDAEKEIEAKEHGTSFTPTMKISV